MSRTATRRRAAQPAAAQTLDLEQAVHELQALGTSLATSYRALEARAERVEHELELANRALERKLAELDEVTADLEAVLAALPTGVIVRDAEGRIVRVNRAALTVLAARAEDVLGATSTELDCADNEWHERELVRNGERVVVAGRRSPVLAMAGKRRGALTGSVEILDDRTRLVELGERLHALDKLAALGNMAGGIAHELRNPMMAVKGFAALLGTRLAPESEEHRWAALIVEGASEADSILSSMMSLASPEKLVLESVASDELVQAAARLAKLDSERAGQCACAFTSEIERLTFVGDRIKLRQALRNLIANAMQAQPGGGAVHVVCARERDQLVLRVQDAGPGIPSALRRRVLEPFFTTRAEGTGLGLALVQRIAELHGGCVEISPQPSPLGGAEVRLRIPNRSPENN
ncbi:MAG: PAS domain-containing protein [Planctomycetes bacterium]|nr:PAS domain-containing protein [Planctomycetota bacterium]